MSLQYENDLFVTSSHGIFYSLAYFVQIKQNPVDLDQRFETSPKVNFSQLGDYDSRLYRRILTKFKNHVTSILSRIDSPLDKWRFSGKLVETTLVNVLRERQLLTRHNKYYYESVLDIYPGITFGFPFFVDCVQSLHWYKSCSKCLTRLGDTDHSISLINNIQSLDPSNFSLRVLCVIWSLVLLVNYPNDKQVHCHFNQVSNDLISRIRLHESAFKDSLNICMSFFNIFLEEYFVWCAHRASEATQLVKNVDVSTFKWEEIKPVSSNFPLTVSHSIKLFIDQLFDSYFQWSEDVDSKRLTQEGFQDNQVIHELISSIIELRDLLKILSKEITDIIPSELVPRRIEVIIDIWKQNQGPDDLAKFSAIELLKLRRFFLASEPKISRYLAWVILKHGDARYIAMLEKVPSPVLLDPRVLHSLSLAIKNFAEADDIPQMDELLLILQHVLKTISSRKRFSHFLAFRLETFDLYDFGPYERSNLPLITKKIIGGNVDYVKEKDGVLFNAYISPLGLLERMIVDFFQHRQNLLSFFVKLCCKELAPLCSCFVDPDKEITLVTSLLDNRLRTYSTNQTIQGIMTFIKEVFLHYHHSKKEIDPQIMTLENILMTFTEDGSCDPDRAIKAKVSIFKLVRNLTERENREWPNMIRNPSPVLYNLLQFIDFFWFDGSKKKQIVELIEFIMNEKVKRKITFDELHWITGQIAHYDEEMLLLSYLEPWLDQPISKIYDVRTSMAAEVLMMAAILPNNLWIKDRVNRAIILTDGIINDISPILRFLCQKEWINLYRFLCYFYQSEAAVSAISEAVTIQVRSFRDLNSEYMTTCLIGVVRFAWANFKKGPMPGSPFKFQAPYPVYLRKLFRGVALSLYSAELTSDDKNRIKQLLVEIAEEMKMENVNAYKAYVEPNILLHKAAMGALHQVYGQMMAPMIIRKPPVFRPI